MHTQETILRYKNHKKKLVAEIASALQTKYPKMGLDYVVEASTNITNNCCFSTEMSINAIPEKKIDSCLEAFIRHRKTNYGKQISGKFGEEYTKIRAEIDHEVKLIIEAFK